MHDLPNTEAVVSMLVSDEDCPCLHENLIYFDLITEVVVKLAVSAFSYVHQHATILAEIVYS